ncbi:MAG: hypothetical protein RMJ98_20820 [Myxococcales bacterium]|nr:hypothetical protein [Polyangiaceae bacterium]MDW8251746.1 hypothetical protein [Myxococcales bacterium]
MNRLLITLAVVALVGCETSPRASTPPDPAPRVSDPQEEKAPLLLSLQAAADKDGVLELQAHLKASGGVSLPVDLSVELPAGAELLDGEARQSVSVPPGRTTRSFRIAYSAPLAPIKVVAHVVHPDKAWGIHAEKLYPEPTKVPAYLPARPPPMARPPVLPLKTAVQPTKEAP